MTEEFKTKREIFKVAGKLRELVTIKDAQGNILHQGLSPLMVEFHFKDILQVVVGAAILSIPVSFTEETWRLGQTMPFTNILIIFLISLIFIAGFTYHNYYRQNISQHQFEFFKRTIFTYLISFGVVAIILTLIQQAPWQTDWFLALKRAIIVAFPASMSATLADTIK